MSTRTIRRALGAALVCGAALAPGAALGAPSGAAFTTNSDGTAVNQNHYDSPTDVYLNGGPGCRAPNNASVLPDGDYHFQVTDTRGRIRSTSALAARRFSVRGGLVVSATAPMARATCGGSLVQLGDFLPSLNGVYKLWIAPVAALHNGRFLRRASKTDSFRVKHGPPAPPDDGGAGGGGSDDDDGEL